MEPMVRSASVEQTPMAGLGGKRAQNTARLQSPIATERITETRGRRLSGQAAATKLAPGTPGGQAARRQACETLGAQKFRSELEMCQP